MVTLMNYCNMISSDGKSHLGFVLRLGSMRRSGDLFSIGTNKSFGKNQGTKG
jgi:hypothetical protein